VSQSSITSKEARVPSSPMPVQELLWHSTVIMTMRYSHTNLEAKVKAVNSICSDKVVTMTPKRRKTA
jgi:hypothetical protein